MKYLSLRQIDWRIVTALVAVNTVCLTAYRQLDFVANGHRRSLALTFSEEAAGAIAGLAVFPLIYLAATRFPLRSPRWRRHLAIHLVAVCAISVVHTTVIALVRMAFFPLLGFGNESYGYLPARYPMEFFHLFIYYWLGMAVVYLFHEVRFARERELTQAKLEARLTEMQLENLRLQLDPHFLFNTLNAISAALYENPATADEMMGRLAELLRHLMKRDRAQTVSLAEELEALSLYTRIIEARLEDRFKINVRAGEECLGAAVPNSILQPLVENAIRHGMDSHFRVSVDVEAHREGGDLVLRVKDRGHGIGDTAPLRTGVGLRNTTERLDGLYGGGARFHLSNRSGGGAEVTIAIPLELAAPAVRETPAAPVPVVAKPLVV